MTREKTVNKLRLMMFLAALAIAGCSGDDPSSKSNEHAEENGHEEAEKGPHGGRMLVDGDFGIEVAVFESGIPPELRLYAYDDGDPVAPDQVRATVAVERLGGKTETHGFKAEQGYLRGQSELYEPHSFRVTVRATYDGESHEWTYDSFEGRTQIAQGAAGESGIQTEPAGSATIRETLTLHGTVVPDPQRVYRLRPRFAGVVKEVRKRLGDAVRAGEVLAVIEADESLQRYNLTAPASGVVVGREANPGVAVGDEAIITIADLSTVWVELAAFQHDLDRVKPGQVTIVRDVDGHQQAQGRVDAIAPVGSAASQSMTVRIVLPNADGRWRPGLFVTGQVVIAETPVPLAVKRSALQSFRDWTVVFEQVGDHYEVRPLELGRQDAEHAEVLSGVVAGARYVSANSYLIKADIEKSGASHDH